MHKLQSDARGHNTAAPRLRFIRFAIISSNKPITIYNNGTGVEGRKIALGVELEATTEYVTKPHNYGYKTKSLQTVEFGNDHCNSYEYTAHYDNTHDLDHSAHFEKSLQVVHLAHGHGD
jgi:hypothetical protein